MYRPTRILSYKNLTTAVNSTEDLPIRSRNYYRIIITIVMLDTNILTIFISLHFDFGKLFVYDLLYCWQLRNLQIYMYYRMQPYSSS